MKRLSCRCGWSDRGRR